MHFLFILICTIPAFLCDNELKERVTRHRSNLTDDDVRVDDIMHILQGVCVYNNPRNNIKQLYKDTESILNDIRVYKDIVSLNKKLRNELKWILQETKGYKEVSRIVNLLMLDVQGTCTSNSHHTHFKDCSEIKASGVNVSGIYTIYPDKGVEVFCDMTTDGGGWTVIQRHSGGSLDFQRTWSEYEQGFGEPSGDLWLGNRIIHDLTTRKKYELRIEIVDTSHSKQYAKYKTFSVGDSASKYTLTIGGYSGDAGDMVTYHNGKKFTTKDQDNDLNSGNCAISYGPWWHESCCNSALNRLYSSKLYWNGSNVIKSVMMIKRL